MNRKTKNVLKKIIPQKMAAFLFGIKPQIYTAGIYVLKNASLIHDLHPIDKKFVIHQLTIDDSERLKYFYTNYKHVLPRLNTTAWIGLAATDTTNNKIAYVSWVIKENIPFVKELDITMQKDQFMVRHGVCAVEYRHQGLHTRMEQERLNWCVRHGAKDIFLHIASENLKGIGPLVKTGFVFLYKKKILRIPAFSIYRELNSAIRSPFKKVM
jgi:hypothetical protein